MRFLSGVCVCLLFLSSLAVAQDSPEQGTDLNPIGPYTPLEIVTQEGIIHKFDVEVRDEGRGRAMGMMHRINLDPDKGMIFLFPRPGRQGFWMKNTLISLDMIFIRSTGRIANILSDVPPQTLESRNSQGRVIAVLELAGGRAVELGIKKGDLVRHEGLNNLKPNGVSGGAD